MNEKFEDLMYRAGLTAQGCWDSMDSYDKEAIEKFAELIVRECADLFEVEYGQSEVSGNEVAEVLKKHFGVEE